MDEGARTKLWQEYVKNKSSECRDKLIVEYAPLVKIVAGRLSAYLGYNVEYDDLVGYGVFGLIDAIDKYDFGKGVKFETYASLRIRGAILDQIRKMDWIPRSLRQKQKKIDMAMNKIESTYGRAASDEEIAREIGINLEELQSWQGQAKITNIVSLDEFVESSGEKEVGYAQKNSFEQPEHVVIKDELRQQLIDSLDSLTEREKKVILLYYYEELTLKEISVVLEVSESRISQLHTKALQKMRVKLGDSISIMFSM